MADPKVEHNGYEIVFYESRDVWYCQALSLENVSLAKLKAAITKVDGQARRLSAIPLIHIKYDGGFSQVNAIQLDLSDARRQRVWCMVPQGGNSPPRREKVDVDSLVEITPENIAKIDEIKALVAEAERIRQAITKGKASLTRVDRERLIKMNLAAEAEDGGGNG